MCCERVGPETYSEVVGDAIQSRCAGHGHAIIYAIEAEPAFADAARDPGGPGNRACVAPCRIVGYSPAALIQFPVGQEVCRGGRHQELEVIEVGDVAVRTVGVHHHAHDVLARAQVDAALRDGLVRPPTACVRDLHRACLIYTIELYVERATESS